MTVRAIIKQCSRDFMTTNPKSRCNGSTTPKTHSEKPSLEKKQRI